MKKNILSLGLALAIAVSSFSVVSAATIKKPTTKKVVAVAKKPVKKIVKKVVATKPTPKPTVKPKPKVTPKPTPIAVKTGILSGAITYINNKAGDGGARIYLVDKTIKLNEHNKKWFLYPKPYINYKINAYVCYDYDPHGVYTFNNIPIGDYVMVVVSAKTMNRKEILPTECPDLLKGLLDYDALRRSTDENANMKIFEVTIKENQTTTLNYNFLDV